MTFRLLCWVAAAGAGGALVRYFVTGALERAFGDRYPVGTSVVNLAGAFGAGWVAGASLSLEGTAAHVVVAIGLLGALTTFSSWMVETVELWHAGERGLATAHVLGGAAAGTALAGAGLWLAA